MFAANSGAVSDEKLYVEDVFSTYLYTGNGSAQFIPNNIAIGDGFNVPPGTSIGGGYFGGFISETQNGVATHALIISPKATGQSGLITYKNSDSTDTGTASNIDGFTNTNSINDSSHPAAQFCRNLSIGGYTDWYLPALMELEAIYYTLKPNTGSNLAGWGLNPYAVYPNLINTAYTLTNPAQTSALLFRTGQSEAFDETTYWTSTSPSGATTAFVIAMGSGFRIQGNKSGNLNPVRAIRRIPVSDPSLDPYRVTGKGGMVWTKCRSSAFKHYLQDTQRGITYSLSSNTTNAQTNGASYYVTSATSSGYTLGNDAELNGTSTTYVSWTFRKAPKFFDVVTYTGNGADGRQINHNLGVAPGMIVIKATSTTGRWFTWHRTFADYQGNGDNLFLDGTDTLSKNGAFGIASTQTPSVFTLGTGIGAQNSNASGVTYVAYLFAHDTTTDGLIQCGSYTGSASDLEINLGWEPQYVLIKPSNQAFDWWIFDNMRGALNQTTTAYLNPNLSVAETTASSPQVIATATGFRVKSATAMNNGSTWSYIYMAIRRGPMRTPTDGTKVFSIQTPNGSSWTPDTNKNVGFTLDSLISITTGNGGSNHTWINRLTGVSRYLYTNTTDAEAALASHQIITINNDSYSLLDVPSDGLPYQLRSSAFPKKHFLFQRAPGFFDVVCYTGTGVARDINHNLGVVPEFYIVKQRSEGSTTTGWTTGGTVYPNSTDYYTPYLNSNQASIQVANAWRTPTKTTFGIGSAYPNDDTWNKSGAKYVAYLFASCPGVSKVGSYTGNGNNQTISCGFSTGARLVIIKRTDNTGDWYVWDTSRGITTGDDQHISLNTTANLVVDDSIDPDSTGFIVNQLAATNINVNNASYIYLAIA